MGLLKFFRNIKFAIDHAKQAEIDLANFKASANNLANIYYEGKTAIRKDSGVKKKVISAKFIKGKVFITTDVIFGMYDMDFEPIEYFTITDEPTSLSAGFDRMIKDLEKMKFDLSVGSCSSFVNLEKRIIELEDKINKLPSKKRK